MPAISPVVVQGSAARIYIDEFELTQQSSGAEFNAEFATESYNIMGEPTAQQYISTPNYSIPHHGYYTGVGAQPSLGYFEETLYSRLGSATPVTVTLAFGPISYTLFGSWGSQLTIDAPVEGLITMDGNWSSPDSIRRGAVAASQAFPTNLLTSTPINVGANVANGFVVHAHGYTPAEQITVDVQTATAEAGPYTTWLSAALLGPKAMVVTGANNPGAWVRVQVALPGTNPTGVNAMVSLLYL